MKNTIVCSAMILIAVGGSLWGQKAVPKADILLEPEWRQIYDDYVPDPGWIDALKGNLAGVRVEVVLGFWCDDSRNNVPLFLKIVDSLQMPDFKVEFCEVARKTAPDQKYYREDLRVEKVPTFIFFADDIEIGRIVENPRESMLMDMVQILLK
ncbi:MAG TPA: thioredoxin family protein [Candidatus Binatia bacterium]|nr:thioredoxin family protein [Candidatus Binatia bacterium]